MTDQDRVRDALSRLAAAGAPGHQARELASDLAELTCSLRRLRERLSGEQEPATTYKPDDR